jgi:hypothetical protein
LIYAANKFPVIEDVVVDVITINVLPGDEARLYLFMRRLTGFPLSRIEAVTSGGSADIDFAKTPGAVQTTKAAMGDLFIQNSAPQNSSFQSAAITEPPSEGVVPFTPQVP